MAAPATPSAFYKMVSIPAAVQQVLEETVPLPAVAVPFSSALNHVIAEDVLAQEPVPGFRASIKVLRGGAERGGRSAAAGAGQRGCGSGRHSDRLPKPSLLLA